MADSSTITESATTSRNRPQRGRGRGHIRNPSDPHNQPDNRNQDISRGNRSQRGGRGRGRGQNRGHTPSSAVRSSDAQTDQSYGRPPGGGFGARLTKAAFMNQGEAEAPKENADNATAVEDTEVCFICASPIDHTSIAPCNHQTCHICALRMRALYKTRACAHCRTESPFVIFTDNPEKHFQDFVDADFIKIDENLGIKYEKEVILEDTILLLRYNCPDKDCDVACLGWPDLHRHVKSKHGKIMCDLCTRNKKVFTHEHELFTFGELRKHEKYGDDNPGAVEQSGFKGHPECGFCRQRFYGDDELYTHCREKHERCHICDRRNGGSNPQYYLNYQELEKHFAEAHFVCIDAECQANKTNVFESEMDLKAHQLSEHPNGLSKDARRDARLVNLSGFEIRTPYQPQRRGGRERESGSGSGSGRGRDPNAEPLPMSSAQPLSRAELAYQRTIAIQSSQSVTPRHFGGQLTQSVPPLRPQSLQQSQRPTVSSPTLENLSLDDSVTQSTSLTPQDQARMLRHQGVVSRAANLLKKDQIKLSQFRNHVSSYRSGITSAADLIDSFFSLFDCPSAELGKLIRELADLYEDEEKRTGLLGAWNNWKSINEDYPSLPGPSGTVSGISSAAGLGAGRRVLKLKSSTAQSSRSAVSRQGSWGNALAPMPNRPAVEAFPALSSKIGGKSTQQSTTWGGSTSSSATQSVSRPTTSVARLPSTMSGRKNEEMFPSLPAAPKPNVMMSGFNTRGSVRWNDRSGTSTPVNAWSNGGMSPTPAQASSGSGVPAENGDDELNGKKKGKGRKGKGKGETLFHFG